MIELTEQQKRAFYSQGYFNRYKMYFPDLDLTIDNETIHTESVKIEESICSNEDLTLGGCIASSCEFEVSEILQNDLSGMEFMSTLETVDEEGNAVAEIPMGKYRVYSVGMVDDRDYKRVVAYDAMHNASASISDWYEELFPVISSNAVTKTDDNGTEITVIVKNYGTTTLKAMRESLLQHLGIPYEEQSLINDDMIVSKSLQPSGDNCTGLMMLKWMCEIHGGFGRMNRNGRFEVTTLQSSGLYPDEDRYPDVDLYPENGNTSSVALGVSDEEPRAEYITAKFEEYMTKYITGINVRTEDDDVGCTVGTTENPYIISGNALLFGKTAAELKPIAENILNVIKDIIYRPNTTELIGLPYVEVAKDRSKDVREPLTTIVSKNEHCLISPTLIQYHSETAKGEVRGQNIEDPIMTVDGSNRYGLVTSFLHKYYDGGYKGAGESVENPLPTVTAWDHNSVVTANLIQMNNHCDGRDIIDPLPTITAGDGHFGEVRAFLIKYYGNGSAEDVTEPLDTITSRGRFGLVTIQGVDYQIVDIGLRMLEPRELYGCQGFPEDYIIDHDFEGRTYPRSEQVRRCGNSVCPPLPAAMVRSNLPELCVAERMPNITKDRVETEENGQLAFA